MQLIIKYFIVFKAFKLTSTEFIFCSYSKLQVQILNKQQMCSLGFI